VVAHLKIKVLQTLLDCVVRYLPSPADIEAIKGVDPDTGMKSHASPMQKNLLLHWLSKL
jgi:elongation factor G